MTLASVTGACLSGQTGSPECVGPESCVCDPLYGAGTLLRVHVTTVETGRLQADVDQVFVPNAAGSEAAVGDHVGGSIGVERPCARGEPPDLKVGDELLVLYSAGVVDGYPNCSELQKCRNSECAGMPQAALTECWASCEQSTHDACSGQRQRALLDGYFAWAVVWQESLDFGGDKRLSSSELSVLETPESCQERFPPDPAPPCQDTRSVMSCRAVPYREASAAGALSGMLALLVLAVVRRRRLRSRQTSRL